LPTSVNTQAYYAERPYVRMLTDLMDRFGQYVIAVLDKESIRIFSVAWGRITPESESLGEALKHHKQEGYYASGYQRHEDNLALHNLKQAAEVIEAYCSDTGCKRIVLAGAMEAVAQVRGLLSKGVQEHVLGEFAVDVTALPHDILERSLDIVAQATLAQEQALVEEAITAAARGSLGVTGVTDALYVLHQGRVRILLADESFHIPGYICDHCGYVLAESSDVCPVCQHKEISETPDVVNRAIQKAHETGAQVTLVRVNEALMRAGGIAAILRY
jgi:peptide subunit release factor 1 (eRF1)